MSIKLNMRHLQPKVQTFGGIYRGVVEDNQDPKMLGRVRVRIFGIHTPVINESMKGGIPTEKLPWSEPCYGLFEGSISGNGIFCVPLQGSHVFVFFEGENWECPRYFATVPGNPVTVPDNTKGFSDPSGTYPSYIEEPDVHRLARNEKIGETIVQTKNDNKTTNISMPDGGVWEEPDSPYNATYPDNIVISTHSGITIELDNTPENVRVHVYHPSKTYIEIDNDGNVVFKNEGDRFNITKNVLYEKSDSKHINIGNNETKYVGGDVKSEIYGSVSGTVMGDVELISGSVTNTINGTETKTVKGLCSLKSDGITIESTNTNTVVGSSITNFTGIREDTVSGMVTNNYNGGKEDTVTGDLSVTVTGDRADIITGSWKVSSPSSIEITTSGEMTLSSSSIISINALFVQVNGREVLTA